MYRMQESAHSGNLRLVLKAAVIVAAVFVVDQVSKQLAFVPEYVGSVDVIPGIFGFTHHQNFGIVANVPIPRWIIIFATVLILALIIRLLVQAIRSNGLIRTIAFSLIVAGAFGNLYDRIVIGYVRDWILLFDRSVINIADIAICAGIVMLLGKGRGIRD